MTQRNAAELGQIIPEVERAGRIVLPRGWQRSIRYQVGSFAAYLMECRIVYESGRRVPLSTLRRGWLRGR